MWIEYLSPCTARRWVWTFSSLRSSHTYILKILSEFDSAWQCFTFWIWKKCFLLFSYFCCLVAARRPCQGRVPWELIWYRVGIVNWFGLTPFWNLRTRQFKAGCHLDEVHEDISKALHIVPPTLLDPKVSVDRRIASRPRQVLVFSEHLQQLWKTVLHVPVSNYSDFTCMVCAGVSVRPDTSWQAQSQWCTQGFPFCPNPWKLIIFYSFIILQFSRTYMRKLSGLMSLWMKFLLCKYSSLFSTCIPI